MACHSLVELPFVVYIKKMVYLVFNNNLDLMKKYDVLHLIKVIFKKDGM